MYFPSDGVTIESLRKFAAKANEKYKCNLKNSNDPLNVSVKIDLEQFDSLKKEMNTKFLEDVDDFMQCSVKNFYVNSEKLENIKNNLQNEGNKNIERKKLYLNASINFLSFILVICVNEEELLKEIENDKDTFQKCREYIRGLNDRFLIYDSRNSEDIVSRLKLIAEVKDKENKMILSEIVRVRNSYLPESMKFS